MENENNQCWRFKDYVVQIVEHLDKVSANIDENIAFPTGLLDLDRMGAEPHRGDVIVFGGYIGSGRTTLLAETVGNQIFKNLKCRVAYLERGHNLYKVAEKIIRTSMHIDFDRVCIGQIMDKDFVKICDLADKFCGTDIYFSEIGDLKFEQVCDRISELVSTYNLEMVIIDGYEFAALDNVWKLKKIAKENNVAILVTSDISEKSNIEKRLPILSDFEGNNGLVKIADVVWILHRPSYYFDDEDADPFVFKLLVPKNKHGQIGVQYLFWNKEKQSFLDMSTKTSK